MSLIWNEIQGWHVADDPKPEYTVYGTELPKTGLGYDMTAAEAQKSKLGYWEKWERGEE